MGWYNPYKRLHIEVLLGKQNWCQNSILRDDDVRESPTLGG
jgi:hypothetical protein